MSDDYLAGRSWFYRRWFHWRHTWYWFHIQRHLTKDAICQRLAWLLPRKLAYWAFIRVYATLGECGPDYVRVCNAWEAGKGH